MSRRGARVRDGLRQLQLDKRSAQAILSGHPWLWPDVFDRVNWRPERGEVIDLLDAVGAPLGLGLAEGRLQPGVPALRMLSLESQPPSLHKLLFSRIAAARRLRERCLKAETTGFRLLNGEGDGLPGLIVDRYLDTLVIKLDCAGWQPHLATIVEALRAEAGGKPRSIVLRDREGAAQALHGELSEEPLVFVEDGRSYLVRPSSGQKTGFFLDQRENRNHVQTVSRPGDRSLNLFSYTGGFSVAMAMAQATFVHSVDLSESIMADCQQQFRLNGIDPLGHRFQCANIFEWLPTMTRLPGEQRYDLVVCDPPALSHRQADLPKARAAYRRLHQGIGPLLSRRALLVTASCTARLDSDDLLDDARAGLEGAGRRIGRLLRRAGAGADHPVPPGFAQGDYLSCLTLVVE